MKNNKIYKRKNKTQEQPVSGGFLLDFWNNIFGLLERLSVFNLIRKLLKPKSTNFVDYWVLGNLSAAVLSTILMYNMEASNRVVIYIVIGYSVLRVFEVIIYQINVLLFHPYRAYLAQKEYKLKSVTRMVVALLNNYVEIMFWYTAIVIALVVLNEGNAYTLTWSDYIKSNILCIATLDGGSIKDALSKTYSHLSDLIFVEIISGIVMTIISLARFIGALPGTEGED